MGTGAEGNGIGIGRGTGRGAALRSTSLLSAMALREPPGCDCRAAELGALPRPVPRDWAGGLGLGLGRIRERERERTAVAAADDDGSEERTAAPPPPPPPPPSPCRRDGAAPASEPERILLAAFGMICYLRSGK